MKTKKRREKKKKGNERGVGVIILSTCVAGAHNSVTTDKIHRLRVVVNLKAVRVSSAYIKRERWMELNGSVGRINLKSFFQSLSTRCQFGSDERFNSVKFICFLIFFFFVTCMSGGRGLNTRV